MALWNNTCPLLGDSDNNLLSKIAQELCEGGGGSGAGVSSISLNGGPPQTGAVSITTGGGGGVTSVNGDPGPAVLLDSGDVPEGLNLYYTQGRFDTAFAGKTTTNLTEGLNLYFTETRVLGTDLAGFAAALGAITAADTVLSAFGKAQGRLAALEAGTAGPFVLRAGDTMTGALLGANGTAALPMFSFSGDTNTGIYRVAADTIGFSVAGTALAAMGGVAGFAVNVIDMYGVSIDHSIVSNLGLPIPALRILSSWDTTDVGSILFVDATDIASDPASTLIDLQLNAVRRFAVSKLGVVTATDGSAAAPTYAFISDPDNGMYLPSANTLGFSTAGVLRLSVSATSALSTVPFLGANGTAAAPTFSFSGDPDNGLYLSAANVLGLSSAGTERVTLSSTVLSTTLPVRGANGSAAAPTFSFTSDADMGMFRSGAGAVGFATGGTERLTLSSTLATVTVPIQQSDSIDLGADPTNATTQWATSGEWKYRSSAASEGAGQTNRVHNRAERVTGSGTDYALTTTMARVDFGTTDPQVTLPTAGTYLLLAGVTALFGSVALSIGDIVAWQFQNSTDATTVPGVFPAWSNLTATATNFSTIPGFAVVTVTASKTIQIYAQNISGARGVIAAANTFIEYVRLS